MKNILAAAALALTSVSASAQAWRSYVSARVGAAAAAACPESKPVVVGATQGYADSLNSGICYVSIDPMSTPGLVYRSYALFSDGLLMVFNSFGEGEGPGMTAAREFFFFPRRGAPALTMDPKAGTVSVRMSDGGRIDFEPATAQASGLERGAVTVAAKVDPTTKGGVEIPRYAGLMLDAGFRVGESPSGRPAATSAFRDASGATCVVKNSDVFAYASDGDHSFKFTDAQLSAWLKTACPALNAGF
jgi:hypothetical protein